MTSGRRKERETPRNDGMTCPFDGLHCTQPECRPNWCLAVDFDSWMQSRESNDAAH